MGPKMKVVIIGAGDQTANLVDLFNVDFQFIFDTPREPGETKYGLEVLNNIYERIWDLHDCPYSWKWISSVGETRHKRNLIKQAIETITETLITFTNLTHPTTTIAKSATRGLGIYMQPYSAIYARAKIEDHVLICGACNVGHHSIVGEYSTLGHQVFLGGHVTIGPGVFLGSGCKIKPGKTIGEGAVIGMGAVVTKDVPANEIWVGNPAHALRTITKSPQVADLDEVAREQGYEWETRMLEPWT